MTTKIMCDTRVCDHKTYITAELAGDVVKVDIETSCEEVQRIAEELKEIPTKELTWWENRIWESAKKLTPTCIVPSAIMNAAWVEIGLVSRSLALAKKEQKIVFLE